MSIKKRKIWLGLFLVMFTAFSSFEMVKDETPCYYFQMFFSHSLSNPAWPNFGEEWYCTNDVSPICAFVYNELYHTFENCMRGVPFTYNRAIE